MEDRRNKGAYGIAADSEELFDEWGPGYFADQAKGDSWFFTGPGIAGQTNAAGEITVGNGDKQSISSVPYAATPTVALLSADVVVFGGVGGALGLVWEGQATVEIVDALELKSTAHANLVFTYEPFLEDNDLVIPAPHGRIYLPDGSDVRLTAAIGTAYCMLPEGCECPEGSPGDNRATVPGTDAFAYIGITGHTNATDFVVEGHSLETYCEIGPAGIATYLLTGGNWTYEFHGGKAVNSCIWPSISASGTITYDPDAHLDIDTSADPPKYWVFARTKGEANPVTVQECFNEGGLRKYEEFEFTSSSVGAVWFFSGFGDPWKPFSGDTISGSWVWGGDPANHASWTLTRSN